MDVYHAQTFRRFAIGSEALGARSFGHSARVRAGSSATSITPRPRKKHGEKC